MSPKGRGVGRARTSFEWAMLTVSLAAALVVVIGLLVSGLTGPDGPGDLRVTVAEADQRASGGRALEVTVTNVGGMSAENVIIEIIVGDVTLEVNMPLVADGETESATVVVPAETTGEPRAEVVSYTDP
jgi:uncharacterized protein (TIGR02588 family)